MEKLLILIDKILPLLTTFLGAYITYYFTVSSKKRESKQAMKIKARDECWIPFAITLLNLNRKLNNSAYTEEYLVNSQEKENWELEFAAVAKFLEPDKKIYFYPDVKNKLALFVKLVDNYRFDIGQYINLIIDTYEKRLIEEIEKLSIYKEFNCDYCDIQFNQDMIYQITNELLSNVSISFYLYICKIALYNGPIMVISTDTSFSDGSLYDTIWRLLNESELDYRQDDFNLTDEQKFGLYIIDLLHNFEYYDITEQNNDIINSKFQPDFEKIKTLLSELEKMINDDIDEISIF